MLDQYSSELAIGHAFITLCKKTGARNGWVQNESELIESNLAASETRVGKIASIVHEMVTSYLSVGRTMECLVFGYREQYLVITCEGGMRSVLVFAKSHGEVGDVFPKARRFLREQRSRILKLITVETAVVEEEIPVEEPVVESLWPVAEERLSGMLARVIGSGQAKIQIDRALGRLQLEGTPANEVIAPFGAQVIEKVPHKGKRQALMAEWADFLRETGLG